MLPDILIHIFYYLKDYVQVSLVCKEWKNLMNKSRHGKIVERLNKIESNISAKSQLIAVAKDLNSLFYRSNKIPKMIKLHDLTKQPLKIWLEVDRASQYLSTETICEKFFEIFDCLPQLNESNIIEKLEPGTWKTLVKSIKLPIFFSSKDAYAYYYSLIHQEHEQKLKQIDKIIRPFHHIFEGNSDYFLAMIYDRLLDIDLKTIKKSCKKLAPLFNDEELLDMSLGYAIGHVPLHDGSMANEYELKDWWPGSASDGEWFAMRLMTSIFDEKLIKSRMKSLKDNFNLNQIFFNHEFKCTIDVFMNLMKLSDECFQLLIDHKDICWSKNKDWILPLIMVDIPHQKLSKRFKLISDACKDGLKLHPSILEMNTSRLKRFIDYKVSQKQ